ncbi:kinase-like protein [Bimuria novae-zelandiae CBS 107.79]|uniref:Kinase-like protein n=1 Tax=Bimuria novae-zelandiae CBS 107.79 TaxID=1447943 RepID=A0A6A5V8I4_9PLEO|nr:kinase-like protein [Bimuria novae-zelandiae CBS 107.79]
MIRILYQHSWSEFPRGQEDSGSSEDSDNDDYKTAISTFSTATYHTAISGTGIDHERKLGRLQLDAEYAKILLRKQLFPVDLDHEKNWSGRGQHVEFGRHEKSLLDGLFQVEHTLGSTSSAIVQSVKCRRILLARKTIRCNRHFTKDQAIEEVAHLTRLSHSHIVQAIGTYTIGNDLSILLYPVAEYNLETFLDELYPVQLHKYEWEERVISLPKGLPCLCNAVLYIHTNMTKHMDIKPRNILVRDVRQSEAPHPFNASFKFYIADFGISRSYDSLDATETEGPTRCTRKYAAPEVVDRERRGLAADIFSLGCVFIEIYSVLARLSQPWARQNQDKSFSEFAWIMRRTAYEEATYEYASDNDLLDQLLNVLAGNELGDTSYQANIIPVQEFLSMIGKDNPFFEKPLQEVIRMISANPRQRPTAEELAAYWGKTEPCCSSGRDKLEAAPTIHVTDNVLQMIPTRA